MQLFKCDSIRWWANGVGFVYVDVVHGLRSSKIIRMLV